MTEPAPAVPTFDTDTRRSSNLSALWILVLLSMLFRDVHELAKSEYLEEILGRAVPEELLLAAGIVLTLPILMVPLSTMLPRAASRPANLVVAAVMVVGIVANAPGDLDDYWFAAVQLLGLATIAWLAWTWPTARRRSAAQ